MMELGSLGNSLSRVAADAGGRSLFEALKNRGRDEIGYGYSSSGYDSLLSRAGSPELPAISYLDDGFGLGLISESNQIMNQGSEGMLVDLVRTLTRSLSGMLDLFQGVLLGEGGNLNSPGIHDGARSGEGRLKSSSPQGLFGALGSIAGNMVDKIFTQLPFFGARGV